MIMLVGKPFQYRKDGKRGSVFECECGSRFFTDLYTAKSGRVKSCGCLKVAATVKRFTKHGASHKKGSSTYNSWVSMRQRCRGTGSERNKECYADRGISICERWSAYENFLSDMGERPTGMTLDRINNDAGYYPENCRWATIETQSRNRRSTILVRVNDEWMCLKDACEKTGTKYGTAKERIRRGMTSEEAVETPVAETYKHRKYRNGNGRKQIASSEEKE